MDTVAQLAALAEGATLNPRAGTFDLSDANMADFMRVYTAGEEVDARQQAVWAERARSFFQYIKPIVKDGAAVLTREQILNFLGTVHANDDHFPRSAVGRRVDALALAIPHLAAQ